MRIAIVNACHPEMQHVCAFRGTTFADILTQEGHQVLLITPPLKQNGNGDDPTTLGNQIGNHDWSTFCHVVGGFREGSILPSVRSGRIPAPFRQMIIGYNYLIRGNIYHDWIAPSSALLPIIASTFKPQIVWAIFGNTSCWVMGQTLAQSANCPWVADIKDNWQAFLPAGFQIRTAQRFTDAAAFTVLSEAHIDTYPGFQSREIKTVYNGISPSLMASTSVSAEIGNEILITGSLYNADILLDVLTGIASWPNPPGNLQVSYAGSDTSILERANSKFEDSLKIRHLGMLTPSDLWRRQRNAKVNIYIRNPPNLFHHKLLELLAAGRPILSYPGETDESVMLTQKLSAEFFPCATATEIHDALEHVFTEGSSPSLDLDKLVPFSSVHQAKILTDLFSSIIEKHGTAG